MLQAPVLQISCIGVALLYYSNSIQQPKLYLRYLTIQIIANFRVLKKRMNRKYFLKTTIAATLATALTNSAIASLIVNNEQFKLIPLRKNLWAFISKGGTIVVHAHPKGKVVVDTQFTDTAKILIEQLAKINNSPIKWLVNTHHHADHTGGNPAFKGLVENIICHENALKNLKEVQSKKKSLDEMLYPNQTFSTTKTIKTAKEKIKLYYFGAAHTNGDAVVHFTKANVVHTGDLMFNRRYPYIDKSAGASIANWIVALQQLQNTFTDDTIFVFGHAFDPEKVIGNKQDILAFQDYLTKLLAHVKKELDAGKTKEDIMKITQIEGVTQWQGDGIRRSLDAAYEELTTIKK
jgi:cyclase